MSCRPCRSRSSKVLMSLLNSPMASKPFRARWGFASMNSAPFVWFRGRAGEEHRIDSRNKYAICFRSLPGGRAFEKASSGLCARPAVELKLLAREERRLEKELVEFFREPLGQLGRSLEFCHATVPQRHGDHAIFR